MPIKCRIWWDSTIQSYVVSSAFSNKLVEGLKTIIPSSDRQWDDTSKFWYITEPYGAFVKDIAEKCFGVGSVSFTSKTVAQQSQSSQQNQQRQTFTSTATTPIDRAIIDFFTLLSYDAAKAAYRRASQELHPDKGGDSEKMTRLNQSWSRIEKEVFHK